jgi:enoyl-CoA hydratase
MNEFVSVHTSDEQPGIATLLLSRPPTNALTRQVYREIVSAAADFDRRDDICAVILFGGHEIFSAGDDMPELRTLSADEAEVARVCRSRRATGIRSWPRTGEWPATM